MGARSIKTAERFRIDTVMAEWERLFAGQNAAQNGKRVGSICFMTPFFYIIIILIRRRQ